MGTPDFKDRLVFDTGAGQILDATRRYLLVRADTFMGLFARLPEPARAQALTALAGAVFEHGYDSARAYLATVDGDAGALLDTIAHTAPQLGWGQWQIEIVEDRIVLAVANSPFAQGYGPSTVPVCHAIAGMLKCAAELYFRSPARAEELACSSCGSGICRFEATRA